MIWRQIVEKNPRIKTIHLQIIRNLSFKIFWFLCSEKKNFFLEGVHSTALKKPEDVLTNFKSSVTISLISLNVGVESNEV